MAVQSRVQVRNEVALDTSSGWVLCLQWCLYVFDDGTTEEGYRFIWRRPGGSLQAARGQARIPSLRVMERLAGMARTQGWGDHVGEYEAELIAENRP